MTDTLPPLSGSYESILQQARAAYRAGDVESAIELYHRLTTRLSSLSQRVFDRRPELEGLHLQVSVELAKLLALEGRFAEAMEDLERAIDSLPDATHILRREIAILLNTKGEAEKGLAELQALAEERSDSVWSWIVLGSEARLEGQFVESEAALARALDVAERDGDPEIVAEAQYHRFMLMRDMKRPDEAIAAWEAAASADADVKDTVHEVYEFLTEAGRYTEALRYVARDENGLRAGLQRGLVAELTGDRRQARQEWQAVAQLDPEEYDSGHEAWVEAVLRLGNPDPALEALQELLRHYASPRLLVLSGIGWAMRGDGELASGLFQRAINLLRRMRPPQQKLDSADWRLLDSLVDDEELQTAVKPYFAVIERIWG